MDQYAGQMRVEHRGLRGGNLSLLIRSIGPSDSGPYRSFIIQYRSGCTVQLNVGESWFVLWRTTGDHWRSPGVTWLFVCLSSVNRSREVTSTVSPSSRAPELTDGGRAVPHDHLWLDDALLTIVSSSRYCPSFRWSTGLHHCCGCDSSLCCCWWCRPGQTGSFGWVSRIVLVSLKQVEMLPTPLTSQPLCVPPGKAWRRLLQGDYNVQARDEFGTKESASMEI